jgi:hypothetical protein
MSEDDNIMALPQPLARRSADNGGRSTNSEIAISLLLRGDISRLNQEERAKYVVRVCENLGIDPLTNPIEIIKLKGREVLYAKKECTDQLRMIHKVSVVETQQEELNGVYIVITKVQNGEGRTDIARGAVSIKGLQGDDLANALMKAETKSKRRATLSITGLGILDESELETIPELRERKSSAEGKRDGSVKRFNLIRKMVADAQECEVLQEIADKYAQDMADFPIRWQIQLSQEYEVRWVDLGGRPEDSPVPAMEDMG